MAAQEMESKMRARGLSAGKSLPKNMSRFGTSNNHMCNFMHLTKGSKTIGRSSSAFDSSGAKRFLPDRRIVTKQRKSTGSFTRSKWMPPSKKADELRLAYDLSQNLSPSLKKPRYDPIRNKKSVISSNEQYGATSQQRNQSASEKHIGRMLSARNIKKRDHKDESRQEEAVI